MNSMNNNWNGRNSNSGKSNMVVPDRIIVRGHDQHYGTKALPRELELESSAMPSDPVHIKMQTPPRSIKISETFNSYHQSNSSSQQTSEGEDDTLVVDANYVAHMGSNAYGNGAVTRNTPLSPMRNDVVFGRDSSMVLRNHDVSLLGASDEELEHLRDQLSRINRRVMSLEEEMSDRKERERYFVIVGIFYAALHAVTWLFRRGNSR